jgi:DNA polymerase III chi subunit, HolC
VTEIWFYHLQRQPLERVLPNLIEKSLEKGWRVAVQARSEERLDALDSWLWTSVQHFGTIGHVPGNRRGLLVSVVTYHPSKAATSARAASAKARSSGSGRAPVRA